MYQSLSKLQIIFGIDNIKEEGIKRILEYNLVDAESAVHAYTVAYLCSSFELNKMTENLIFKNFEIVSKTEQFLDLNIDALNNILLSNPSIYCTKIFEGVLSWVFTDLEG